MKITSKYINLILLFTLLISCSEEKISLNGTGTITGKVVSKGDYTPIENTKISTNPSTSTVFTNELGEFIINDAAIGSYSVEAQKEGYLSKFESTTITEDGSVDVVFELDIATANNKAPNTTELVTPVNNAVDQSLSLDLVWTGSDPEDDDLIYEVKIFNNNNTDVLNYTEINDTILNVSGLNYGTKYFWQVWATDNINDAVISETFSFKTIDFPENRMFFTRKINGNNVIFSSDDEGNEYQLTSENNNSWRPRKASNLNTIAFLRSNGGQIHIYTMNLDGSNVVQVTNNIPVNGFNPEELDFTWKSNNSQLMYPNFDKLYQINANGSGLTQIHQTLNGNFITEIDWNQSTQKAAVKTNNVLGYNTEIYTINSSGAVLTYVLQGVPGAAGGLDFSFDGSKLLYTYDVSGNQNDQFRQLNTQMFIYNFNSSTVSNISTEKTAGTNDLDPRFSPNEAEVIFVNTSNDGVSLQKITKIVLANLQSRSTLIENGKMPDWQ